MKVIAIKKHVYASRPRIPGETYEAEAKDLIFLTKVGFVKLADPVLSEVPVKRRYKRRDMQAEET